MAVFLVIGALVLGAIFIKKTGIVEERGILGGPAPAVVSHAEGAELGGSATAAALVGNQDSVALGDEAMGEGGTATLESPLSLSGNALKDPGVPIGPAFDRSGTVTYEVQKGDTLSGIASFFGVSVQTIINANPGVKSKTLQIGEQLSILPTSGVVYVARSGDTLASISTKFNVPEDKLTQFNGSVNFSPLDAGVSVIIPGGTEADLAPTEADAATSASLPNFDRQFVIPAKGYNWGILHHNNAVDIANSCGTPVVAAAAGIVVPDPGISDTLDGWNGGYGNFVLIEHSFGNNVETRYAHLEKTTVQIGDYVKQGQKIGLMGETGDATGCHVHFEVLGAHNPFAKSS